MFVTLQVSTYKIVTVNATRQMVDMAGSSSQGTSQQPRLTSHPEDSATVEETDPDNELHQLDDQSRDEMQTWMLLEVSPPSLCTIVAACLQHTD